MAFPVTPRRLVVLAALATAVAACSLGDSTTGVEEAVIANPRTTTFSPAFAPPINLATMTVRDSGLFVQDFTVGTGDSIVAGDTAILANTFAQFHYRVWLSNGTLVEELQPPTPPAESRLRQSDLIVGWRAGMQGMRVGGRRRLVMSPLWGYGLRQNGAIPGNSVLVFEISLTGIRRL
jgi:FKBP-type peptidyl-prolyl cis-trans isomerase